MAADTYFRRGVPKRPDVFVRSTSSGPIVVKDCHALSPWRREFGALVLRREAAALERLRDLPGMPRAVGFLHRHALAIEFIEGLTLDETAPPPGRQFWQRLHALVTTIHARGVAHGDLDQPGNMLVRPDGTPALIDFSNAFLRGDRKRPATGFEILRRHDLHCVSYWQSTLDRDHDEPAVPTPPPLAEWQRRLLVAVRKLDRPSFDLTAELHPQERADLEIADAAALTEHATRAE